MTGRPHIERLVWDDWNLDHIAKHDVLPQEAEDVIAGEPTVDETYKQRMQLIGPSAAGRMLSIVIGAVPDQPNVYYVFSARPASRKERADYARRIGGSRL
jgi:uncharacterized DUF497 family protein